MPEYNLGTAQGTIRITEDTSGVRAARADLDAVRASADQTSRGLDKSTGVASRFGAGLKKAAGIGVVAVGAVTAGVTALIAKGGLDRALNIQDAQEKLRGLGHDTKSITTIMDSALASVKGTAFGLDEAATTAATAVAAGIKPGKELTRYLKITADTATIAGTSLGEVGSILNQATSSGVVFTDTLNQLSDRGIPVFPYLQKELGLSGAELRKFVSKGKLDVDTLTNVLEKNLAGSALASGNTTRGALKNVGAAFSRLGAQVLAGPVASAPKLFQTLSLTIDRFAAAVKPATVALGGLISEGMAKLTGYLETVQFDGVVRGLQQLGKYATEVVRQVQSGTAKNGLAGFLGAISVAGAAAVPALQAIRDNVGPLASAFGDVIASGVKLLPDILQTMAGAMQFLADHSGLLKVAIVGLAAAYLLQRSRVALSLPLLATENALKLAGVVASTRNTQATIASYNARRIEAGLTAQSSLSIATHNALLNVQTLRYAATTLAAKAAAVATGIFTGAVRIASGGLKAFAVALTSTGIGAVIVAIGLLVAALVYFFTQTETGRKAWAAFTRFIGEAWTNAVKLVQQGIEAAKGFFDDLLASSGGVQGFFEGLQGFAGDFARGWSDAWAAILGAVQPVVDYFNASVLPILEGTAKIIGDAYANAGQGIAQAFQTVVDAVNNVVSFFQTTVAPIFSDVFDTVKDAISSAVDAISAAWAQIQPVIQPVIDYITGTVIPTILPFFEKFGYILGVVAAIIVALPLAALAVALGVVAAAIVGVVLVAAKLVEFFAGLAGAVAVGVQTVVGFLAGVWAAIVAGIQTFIATVVGIWNGLVSFFAGVGAAIGQALAPFVNYFQANVVPVFVAAAGTIQAVINLIVRAVSFGFQLLVSVIQTSLGVAAAVVSSVWSAIAGFVSAAVARVSSIVRTVFSAIGSFISTVLNTIKGVFSAVWSAIASVVSAAVSRVSSVIRTVLNPIVAFVSGIINKVRSTFQAGFNAVASVVSSVVGRVVGFVRSGLNPIIGIASQILNGFKNAIQTGISNAISFFSGIRSRVIGFFGGAASWLYNAGVQVLTGFLNGLKSMFDNITGFLGQVTAAIPKHKGPPEKDLKLLYSAGQLIMQGLQNGLQDGERPLLSRLDALTAKIASTVGKGVQDRGGYFASVGKNITDNLVDKTGGSTDSLREYLQDLAASVNESFDKLADARKNASANLAKAKASAAAKLKQLNAEYAKAKGDRKKTIAREISEAKKAAADEQAALKGLSAEPGADQKSTVAKFLETDNAVLTALAEARDRVADQLSDAQKSLDDAVKVRADFADSVLNAVVALGNVSKAYNDAVSQASAAADKADSLKTKIADLDASITSAATDRQALLTKIASFTKQAQRASTSSSARLSALNQVSDLTDQLAELDEKVANYGKTRDDLSSQMAEAVRTSKASPVELLTRNLQQDVDATTKFNGLIDQLKKLGLDDTTYKQVVDSFLQTGDTSLASDLLSGGADAVRKIGDLQAQLAAAGKKLGADTSGNLYDAGVNAAQGIVDGLKSQQSALEAEMQHLAQVMVDSLKKSLGIASPSKRAEKEVGRHIPSGIARGIVSGYGTIVTALQGVGGLLASAGQLGVGVTSTGASLPLSSLSGSQSTTNNSSKRTLVYNNYGSPGISGEDDLFQAMRRSRTAVPGW